MKQERSEKVLMGWYLMRSGQARAPYASFQWDVLLNQALGDIKKKFSVEKVCDRDTASLLSQSCSPHMSVG